MMEPDFEAAKLRVYEEFGIWKPGEKTRNFCHVCAQTSSQKQPWSFETCRHQRDIPPPELTDAIAWQVLIAAAVESEKQIDSSRIEDALLDWFGVMQSYDDPKHALILALAGAYEA